MRYYQYKLIKKPYMIYAKTKKDAERLVKKRSGVGAKVITTGNSTINRRKYGHLYNLPTGFRMGRKGSKSQV